MDNSEEKDCLPEASPSTTNDAISGNVIIDTSNDSGSCIEPTEQHNKVPTTGTCNSSDSLGENKMKLESDTCTGGGSDDGMSSLYHVKWIYWRNEMVPIVTQNENGPCPLLAIFNVLLLSNKVSLRKETEIISSNQIMAHVADVIWENMPKELPENERLNYEQNVSDAMSVFPNLQTGLDVNVKFSSVSSFEYTPELTVFDLLRIPLFHGWLVDPQNVQVQEVIGSLSYNQIVEKIINCSSSQDPELSQAGIIAQQFLESTASQITCHGIVCLCEHMQTDGLAVLFRNNHFSTLFRHKDELFTLITDLGFLRESTVVWETLSSVHGDSSFVDGNFLNSPPKTEPTFSESPQNTDLDYQIALSLQQNESVDTSTTQTQQSSLTDYELAKQLQQIEMDSRDQVHPSSGYTSRPQTTQSPIRNPPVHPNNSRPASAPVHPQSHGTNSSEKCIIL